MKRIVTYATGTLALLIVAIATVSALVYATTHGTETLQTLATGTVQGVGAAIGGLIGGALMLRFQAARSFIKNLLKDVK